MYLCQLDGIAISSFGILKWYLSILYYLCEIYGIYFSPEQFPKVSLLNAIRLAQTSIFKFQKVDFIIQIWVEK